MQGVLRGFEQDWLVQIGPETARQCITLIVKFPFPFGGHFRADQSVESKLATIRRNGHDAGRFGLERGQPILPLFAQNRGRGQISIGAIAFEEVIDQPGQLFEHWHSQECRNHRRLGIVEEPREIGTGFGGRTNHADLRDQAFVKANLTRRPNAKYSRPLSRSATRTGFSSSRHLRVADDEAP